MRATAFILLILSVAVAATGCRAIPREFDHPEPGFALAPATDGPLAELSRAFAARVGDAQSGFLLLDKNDESLWWRLALIDSAERSLDVMTYLWAADFSGRLLVARMQQAANRGVRVRVLVDDFLTRRRDREIAALYAHPNIEIRIWNPGRQRRLGRNVEYLVRLRELNHRLHNKVLIADNRVVISGGRNLADAYWGLSEDYNFFDLDLLAVGPVVPPTSGMFDRYWNSPQAVPGHVLYGRASADDIPNVTGSRRRWLEASPLSALVPLDPEDWTERFDDAVTALVPGDAEVIYDKPGEGAPSQDALVGLQRFFRRAEHEVLVANAYLVPGEPFFAEAALLEERGVDMAIITNSLGSTNQTIVHHAYARARVPMLEAGVRVFEMRYDGAMHAQLDTPPVVSDWIGLHAKAAVLDRKHVFIGSFNFSPRSRNLNTEMGILVHSEVFGAQVAAVMDRVMAPENAWQLRLDQNNRLAWESADGTLTRQPAQSFWRRVQNGIFGLFPVEQHL